MAFKKNAKLRVRLSNSNRSDLFVHTFYTYKTLHLIYFRFNYHFSCNEIYLEWNKQKLVLL